MAQPNILFIMADQMSAKAMPMYGHALVQMPALSRLADAGVVFERAYCNSPLCGPSRMSMLTGLLPSRIGAYDNASELPASRPTFAHYLRRLGYRTCLSGKMHFVGPDQLHGYEERLTTDIYPADFGWTANWAEPEAKVRFQDMTNVLETGPCARSMQIDYDDDVAYQAERWLYDRARDDAAQPFFLTVSFTSPHDPYVALPEFWNLYRTGDIDLPDVPALMNADRDAHSARIIEHYAIGEPTVSEETIRRARHGYYASISYVDAKVARLMAVLRAGGLDNTTIVVFSADHGDMMGERGLYYKKTFFEWSARVPLIVHGPGCSAHRARPVVSLLDLLPTFVEMAGGSTDEILETDGLSVCPAARGDAPPERIIAGEFLAEGVFEPAFMLRDDRYKLLYSEVDAPVLFDLDNDPAERVDLAADPAHGAALNGLLSRGRALWDAGKVKADIIADQNRRRLINQTHGMGVRPSWDYAPTVDAANQYVRAGRWTTEVEAKAHLPVREE